MRLVEVKFSTHHGEAGNAISGLATWVMIALATIAYVVRTFFSASSRGFLLATLFGMVVLVAVAFIHGSRRYGWKNLLVFFAITWVVANTLESVSIATGFPFGYYHYNTPGPRIFEVPVTVMPGYFAMAYMAWAVGGVLLRQFGHRPCGASVFLLPLVASFVMVMWDVVLDPVAATVNHAWVWHDGGTYFGVPISNYLGWFLTVFVFFQLFSLYVARNDTQTGGRVYTRQFVLQPVAVYGMVGLRRRRGTGNCSSSWCLARRSNHSSTAR